LVIRFVYQEDIAMYSVVVLMALTTATEAPDGRGGRGGCGSSCSSGCSSGCYSGCSSGYCGSYGYYGGCQGGVCGFSGAPAMEAHPAKPKTGKKGSEEQETSTSATIVVNLPAEATLTIDGAPTTSTSDRRVFNSPELTSGKNYYYMFKAQVIRDGKTLVVEQKVPVTAGATREVTLTIPASEGIAAR
jgi:uncharacterized protein (TIGR03000 family)